MKKAFDAVQWMRERRRQIDEEDRDLTWDEKRQRTHDLVMRDPVTAELCKDVIRPEQLRPVAVREESEFYGPQESGQTPQDS